MTQDDVLTYGITQINKDEAPAALHVEELRRNGYTILPDVFSASEVTAAKQSLDAIYEIQRTALGAGNLEKMNDHNIARCPLAYDDLFLKMATPKIVLTLLAELLGENYVLMMQNGIINREDTKQYQSRWHRDLNYQHWTSSRPLIFNFLVALDEFTYEGGATMALPASHLHSEFPSETFVRKHEVCLEAAPGSVIIADGMTFHRAGVNRIPGFIRRGLNHVVGLPFMGQQIDMPVLLKKNGKDLSGDPFLYNYLGYRWNPASDVEAWRQKRLR